MDQGTRGEVEVAEVLEKEETKVSTSSVRNLAILQQSVGIGLSKTSLLLWFNSEEMHLNHNKATSIPRPTWCNMFQGHLLPHLLLETGRSSIMMLHPLQAGTRIHEQLITK